MQEKVSVIVPIYNVEKYLRRCVDSLVRQIYENIEILLIDDCSTDESSAIAKEYAEKYPQLCYFIRREKNGGLSAARNTGIEVSTGEWLAFVDSDDWVTEDYVSAMYEAAEKDQADIVMSSIYYYYPNGNYKEMSPFLNLTTESTQKEKVALCRPYAVTRLFRKEFVLSTGLKFPTNVWRAAEQGLIIPLLTRTSKISIVQKPMYYYYQRSDSNSNKNYKGVDVSFYPKSCKNVEENSAPGFEKEIEFRAISDLMYGMIMIMIRSGKSKSEIYREIDSFNEHYSKWDINPYMSEMPKGKRIFVELSKRKRIIMQKNFDLGLGHSEEDIKLFSTKGKNEHKKNIIQIGRIFILIIGIAIFTFCYFQKDAQGIFHAILLVLFSNLLFSLSQFEKRLAYTLFLASFFCFMLGRMFVDYVRSDSVNFYFSENVTVHILLLIFISLIFLQLGVEICEIKCEANKINKINESYKARLQSNAQILFFISAFMAIIMNVEQFVFIQKYSYVEIYKDFVSNIPRILQILGNMYIAAFIVFLATCPSKRRCILPMILFSIVTMTLLLSGDRGIFVCNFAVLVVYIFWRQFLDHEIWISKKLTFIGIACIPILLAGLSFFSYIREGADIGERTIIAQLARFFKVTGNSVDILGYGKEYQNQFPRSMYSFGELIDYVKYNPISKMIFGIAKPQMHTVEYVETMHSYAHAISYFISPESYLLGHGKGSSYIAEVYHDFGYIGVGMCNLVYGIFLSSIYKVKNCNPFLIASMFIALRILFYVPRGPMILPLSYILNITTVFTMLLLWGVTKFQLRMSGDINNVSVK